MADAETKQEEAKPEEKKDAKPEGAPKDGEAKDAEKKDGDEKGGDFDRDSDVLTSDDFKSLEADEEKKKGLLSKIFKKKEDEGDDDKEEVIEELDNKALSRAVKELKEQLNDIQIKGDKTEGKIELNAENTKSMGDRLGDLNERIGELRSTVVSREKFFDRMEKDFVEMKDQIHDINPRAITKKFEEKDVELVKLDAGVEKANVGIENVRNELKGYRDQMNQIKSFNNLLENLNVINDKVKEMEQARRYVDRVAAKLESMISEINQGINAFNQIEEKVTELDKLSQDAMNSFDNIDQRFKEAAGKDDLTSIKKDIETLKTALFEKDLQSFEKGGNVAAPAQPVAPPTGAPNAAAAPAPATEGEPGSDAQHPATEADVEQTAVDLNKLVDQLNQAKESGKDQDSAKASLEEQGFTQEVIGQAISQSQYNGDSSETPAEGETQGDNKDGENCDMTSAGIPVEAMQKLVTYVNESLKEGKSIDDIKGELKGKGVNDETITKILACV